MKAVSLFSGAGGMDVGAAQAGFRIVLANEIDADACATYRLNHSATLFEGSVLDLAPTMRLDRSIDLVFGGPPCQGFSVAGKMNPDDPRSKLIRSFFEIVNVVQPKAFVCENVKALAVLEKWKPLREVLIREASELFNVEILLLRASDFGVPQNRERMFIIGVRKDIQSTDDPFSVIKKQLKRHFRAPDTVAQVIRSLGPAGAQGNRRVCNARITYAKSPVLRASPYAGMLFNGAGRPLREDGVAATLPASMGGNKTPIVDEKAIFEGASSYVEEYHSVLVAGGGVKTGDAPHYLRRLTVDECLAFQSFPPDYELAGSKSAMFRQIGNAVPCKLAFAVLDSVAAALRSPSFKSEIKAAA